MDVALPTLDCRTCGACCTDIALPPYTVAELVRLGPMLKSTMLAWIAASVPGKAPCAAYDAERRFCRIYRDRPAKCRDFEPGSGPCLTYRRKVGLA